MSKTMKKKKGEREAWATPGYRNGRLAKRGLSGYP